VHAFRIPNSCHVEQGGVRLLSPQHWAKTQSDTERRGTGSETTSKQVELFWGGRKFKKTVPLDASNVATLRLAPGCTRFGAFCAEAEVHSEEEDAHPTCFDANVGSDDEDDGEEDDLHDEEFSEDLREWTPVETSFDLDGPPSTQGTDPVIVEDEEDRQTTTDAALFLHCHQGFGHASPAKLQLMAKAGIIPRRLAKCPAPVCSSCLCGKAAKHPWRGRSTKKSVSDVLPVTRPGHVISVDQLVSPTPGLIAQMSGFLTNKRHRCAKVFVDNFSSLSFVWSQKTATAAETIEAKKAFEAHATTHGAPVLHCHADNGVFDACGWRAACAEKGHGLSFAGVNAHDQNGKAERRIGVLQEQTRTQLIHANRRWPTTVTANLWPHALHTANDSITSVPSLQDKRMRSPIQIFSSTEVDINPKHFFHFGCPVCVLSAGLQGSARLQNKWRERSRVGVCLGRSPQHSRQVALVLDLATGRVSPQFHVAFDPSFQTRMRKSFGDSPPPSHWQVKCGFVQGASPAPGDPPPTALAQEQPALVIPPSVVLSPVAASPAPEPVIELPPEAHVPTDDASRSGDTPTLRHSNRRRSPVERLIEVFSAEITSSTAHDVPGELFALSATCPEEESEAVAQEHPLLAHKATSDPDALCLHEAMRALDWDEFKVAMDKECSDQMANGNYEIMLKIALPKGASLLPTVWQFKRKRDLCTGAIKKHKARLCLDGSKQTKGADFWETCAQVATWNSIRVLLIMSLTLGWHTKQLDCVQAFPQAPPETQLCTELPTGIHHDGCVSGTSHVMKVLRNACGSKQAGRTFNKHLVAKLASIGFSQSRIDPCVFCKGGMMHVLCTHDSMLAGPGLREIEECIEKMKKVNLDITVEGDLSDFLGVNIDQLLDGSHHLSQPKLIDSMLEDLRLSGNNVATKSTPLSRHPESASHDNSFHC
jgi:hypothetical protein